MAVTKRDNGRKGRRKWVREGKAMEGRREGMRGDDNRGMELGKTEERHWERQRKERHWERQRKGIGKRVREGEDGGKAMEGLRKG